MHYTVFCKLYYNFTETIQTMFKEVKKSSFLTN